MLDQLMDMLRVLNSFPELTALLWQLLPYLAAAYLVRGVVGNKVTIVCTAVALAACSKGILTDTLFGCWVGFVPGIIVGDHWGHKRRKARETKLKDQMRQAKLIATAIKQPALKAA